MRWSRESFKSTTGMEMLLTLQNQSTALPQHNNDSHNFSVAPSIYGQIKDFWKPEETDALHQQSYN